MIKVKANGVETLTGSVYVIIDCTNYFTYIEFFTQRNIPANTAIEIDTGSVLAAFVIASDYNGTGYVVKAVSERQQRVITALTKPVYGMYDAKALLNTLGIKEDLKVETATSLWILPSLSFKELINSLNHYTEVPNGGCPHFYLDFDGAVKVADLKLSLESADQINLLGHLASDVASYEWMLMSPAKASITKSTVEAQEVVKVDLGESDEVILNGDVFTDEDTNYAEKYLKYEYLSALYKTRRLNYTEVRTSPHYPGQKVANAQFSGVVTRVELPIQTSDEELMLKVQMVCPK